MVGIYKITNPKGKIYVGKTKNFPERINQYKNLTEKNQRKLFYSFQKYGYINHKFEMIEECKFEELNEKEIFWIKKYNSVKNGLNLTYGGDGGLRSKESIELGRLKILKPILQYDLEGNFIKEFEEGAVQAIKELKKGNSNNINDCARGKYYSTYGYRWKYKKDVEDISIKLPPIEQKLKTKFQLYINENFISEYFSWEEINKSGINMHTISKCLHSDNNEYINKENGIKYKIIKIKL